MKIFVNKNREGLLVKYTTLWTSPGLWAKELTDNLVRFYKLPRRKAQQIVKTIQDNPNETEFQFPFLKFRIHVEVVR